MVSIALTGHRPSKLDGYDLTTPFYVTLRERLLRVAVGAVLDARELDRPFATLHSGMALGADTLWAQVICDLKEHYPGEVHFVAHVPFPGQCARWPAASQQVYRDLLARADQVRTYGTEYTPAVMQARNVGMIDAAERLVAIFNGHPQGALRTPCATRARPAPRSSPSTLRRCAPPERRRRPALRVPWSTHALCQRPPLPDRADRAFAEPHVER